MSTKCEKHLIGCSSFEEDFLLKRQERGESGKKRREVYLIYDYASYLPFQTILFKEWQNIAKQFRVKKKKWNSFCTWGQHFQKVASSHRAGSVATEGEKLPMVLLSGGSYLLEYWSTRHNVPTDAIMTWMLWGVTNSFLIGLGVLSSSHIMFVHSSRIPYMQSKFS